MIRSIIGAIPQLLIAAFYLALAVLMIYLLFALI